MGPLTAKENPTYKDVCSGSTGHVEVYDFEFTSTSGDSNATYESLVKFFFQFHDPTIFNAQEQDTGPQYASVIYAYTPEQADIAKKVIKEVQTFLDKGLIPTYRGTQVTTDVRQATIFYPAHEEHQEYLDKDPSGYCNHRYRIKTWPTL